MTTMTTEASTPPADTLEAAVASAQAWAAELRQEADSIDSFVADTLARLSK